MHHPSGYLVYFDAEQLSNASSTERPELLESVVDGILAKDIQASNTAYWLARDLAGIEDDTQHDPLSFETDMSHGKFSAAMSLELVKGTDRLQGFINAIRRWPDQEAIMDVGCGSFPILALAAAVYHPRAEVQAIEINPKSAESAETIVGQFGLKDRVHIINADVANHAVDPNVTAAVTETFNSALQEEPGPKIVQELLHRNGIPIITPSRAELRLQIGEVFFYQGVDLRTDTHARIEFEGGSQCAEDYPDIRAAYFDDYGLVLPYDTDTISGGLPLSRKMDLRPVLASAGSSGQLSYELGRYPFEPSATVIEAV